MIARSIRVAVVAVVGSAIACGGSTKGPPPEQAALGGDVAARVGADVLPVSLVTKVAADQHVTPREALRRLVDDAVCASAARSGGRDTERPTPWLLIAARARWTADRIMAEARQAGPPTDAEIEALTLFHWREVARPAAVHVVHALAMNPKKTDDLEGKARAKALGAELRAAVLPAKDVADFQARARAVPHPPELQVVIEVLPAFASDGWITEGDGRMIEPFAKAAHELAQPGDTSAVIETSFGWHVIRLIDRVPAQMMAPEAKRVAFADEAIMQRAHNATEARVKALRAAQPVEVSPSAELLMRTVSGTTDHGPPP